MPRVTPHLTASGSKLFFTSPETLVAGAPAVLYMNRARSGPLHDKPNIRVGSTICSYRALPGVGGCASWNQGRGSCRGSSPLAKALQLQLHSHASPHPKLPTLLLRRTWALTTGPAPAPTCTCARPACSGAQAWTGGPASPSRCVAPLWKEREKEYGLGVD